MRELTMNLIRWLGEDSAPGTVSDLRWAWVTVALSAAVASGYIAIAVNRYFQAKLGRRDESRVALARLRNIVLCSFAFGVVFYATDMAWTMWRLYDLALLALAVYTWGAVVRMRGPGLVDERLAKLDELERLAAENEELARQKAFFLNALSHDLRAPLNIVALNAHLLKTSAREEAEVESAKLIIENATAAGSLLTKALELAKADAEDHNSVERVSVAGVLHDVARRFAPVSGQKGLSMRVDADQDVEVMSDRQKLERVVSNLVDNAIKFTERGGVTLELLPTDGGGAAVRVTDTGMGVDARHAPHLFDEFYQAKRGPGGSGFGMGLAICRFLARQLGGDARLVHTGPVGSCFEVTVSDMTPRPVEALSHVGRRAALTAH
jgi:signal transduction histidine kinase